jgi:lambda family phage portal protein
MDRNDTVVGSFIDRAVINTLQDGFTLQPKTGDKGLDKELLTRWEEWSTDADQCDLAGERTWYDIEYAALRAALVDGDMIVLPHVGGELEMVEAHRLRTPLNTRRNVVHGVLMDDNRKRQEYWLTRDDVDPLRVVKLVSDMRRYAVRDDEGHRQLYHIFNPKRVSQTRGVTAFAPVFNLLGMIEDVNFAKLVQQQVISCFAILRMPSIGAVDLPSTDQQLGARKQERLSDGTTRIDEAIAPGQQIVAEPGEKIEGFSPNVPGSEYFPHMKFLLTLVGINFGVPLVMAMMDASETNFSGFRGAVDEARKGFRRNQRWLIERLHRPAYGMKVRQWGADDPAIAAAAKRTGIFLFRHAWSRPVWPYIEPLKDASTDLLRKRNGLTSPRRLQAERGQSYPEITRETVEDNALAVILAKRKADRINTRFDDGQPVHWRDLLSMPSPDGVTVSLGPETATITPTKQAEQPSNPPPRKK